MEHPPLRSGGCSVLLSKETTVLDYVTARDRIARGVKINPITGCWEWQEGLFNTGYGQVWFNGRTNLTHRISYTAYVSTPVGSCLDHLCNTRKCCNPSHLDDTTHQVNTRRRHGWTLKEGVWYCGKGHEVTNPVVRKVLNNKFFSCRECKNAWQ